MSPDFALRTNKSNQTIKQKENNKQINKKKSKKGKTKKRSDKNGMNYLCRALYLSMFMGYLDCIAIY